MKKTLLSLTLACAALGLAGFLATGCATATPEGQSACDAARAAYEVYLADRALREPTPEEVRWAAAAALFLRTQCGWTAARGVDAHGVPIVVAPRPRA